MAAFDRARIEAYIGASGSGKGVSIRLRLAELQPARLLIWDPRDEYRAEAPAVATVGEAVRRFVSSAPAGPCRVRYVPGAGVKLSDAFALLCRLAFEAGSLVFLAEELSDVTSASWAPDAWRRCITQGRHRALHLLGATQRPALIDKTFLANATRVRCGAVGYEADRRAMAAELDTSRDKIAELRAVPSDRGGAKLLMLERDRQAGTLDLVQIWVHRGGKATETRASASSTPLRGTACHVDRRGLHSGRSHPQPAPKGTQ